MCGRGRLNGCPSISKRPEVILGEGELREALENQVKHLHLERHVFLTGFRTDVLALLKCFDLFVMSSETEGLGTSILDAQAAGLPVAACRAGGIPEIVADRETGLLVPPGDPPALAAALLELARDPELRAKLGAQAKKSVQGHDVSRAVAAQLDLYRSLVSSPQTL